MDYLPKKTLSPTSGKVLMEADEIIELKSTDEEGKITFVADLPIGGTYYVKELYAPDGFVTNDEERNLFLSMQVRISRL